ncbi:hypothetical protein BpHYR1_053805 [Brachionus plicatilis]|uniref:Uncharacterized protein n=1 Tax=Brachionus plicatilis TaxID=10195 RepID=A0A3M7TAX5_BRAPC|nr:hypothetical protein BpHYR1_053805 [Brachionus plicatilis]
MIFGGTDDQTIKVLRERERAKPLLFVEVLIKQPVLKIEKDFCIKTLKGHTYSVNCLAIFDNKTFISGSLDETIKVSNNFHQRFKIKPIINS